VQVKIALILLLSLLFTSYLVAEEAKKVMYIGYLKPYERVNIKKKFRTDPTEEPAIKIKMDKESKNLDNLDLKGILYNPDEKKAFINGELYKEGDIVEGYMIYKIFSDKVILKKDNFQVELKID